MAEPTLYFSVFPMGFAIQFQSVGAFQGARRTRASGASLSLLLFSSGGGEPFQQQTVGLGVAAALAGLHGWAALPAVLLPSSWNLSHMAHELKGQTSVPSDH